MHSKLVLGDILNIVWSLENIELGDLVVDTIFYLRLNQGWSCCLEPRVTPSCEVDLLLDTKSDLGGLHLRDEVTQLRVLE